MSTPRRAPPGPPTPPTTDSGSSPSSPTVNIEDKYYVGLSNTPSANSSSPAALEPKQPPPSILSQGPQEVASWYQQEAARLHQHANLSQQRNQMLVQKVLAMRRQLAAPSISTTTPSKSSGHKDTRTTTSSSTTSSSSGSSTTTNSPSTYLPSASFPPSPSPAAATDSATDSTTSSTFTVRELDDSPMHQLHQHTQPSQFNSEDQGTMNDLAWTELKLQRSHHNFHALSKRTRQVETSNANAASMIVDLRHALEVSRVRTEEMTRREQEGRSLVSQLSNHVDSLKKQTQLSQEKITVYEQVKNEAEERATKWKKERREIGGYALRLEKETEQVTAALQRCQKEHQTMKGELEETRGAVREMHGKLKAQAETSRLQLSNVAEIDPLHRSISSSVLALKRETQRDHQKSILHVQHELEDVRERLDAQTNQLQEANTRNEVLTVRASHAQRLSEEYREKSRKLQEIMTSGASVQESDRSTLLSKVATLESQLLMSQKESERCHVELTSVLSAMETARDRLLQSSESKDHVERQCDQLRQAVKDAESKTRVFTTRYDVLNEDCLASKKEIGALQADTVHLEQQLMATQRKLSAAQQSESTSNLTRNSFEKQLDTAQQHIQEARTKVNHCEAKLHTAENEVYRAKTEMEEERRITERRREQTAVATQKQDTLLAELLAKHQHELEEEQHINNALRSEIAQVTTESLYVAQATAANATTDASTVLQYKKEMNDMCDEVRKKEESHAIVVERLAQQKLDAVGYREHIEALKKTNTGMVLQMKDMEETMMIKDEIFTEHTRTADKLTKERNAMGFEITALQKALTAERNGTAPLFQQPKGSSGDVHTGNNTGNTPMRPANTATATATANDPPTKEEPVHKRMTAEFGRPPTVALPEVLPPPLPEPRLPAATPPTSTVVTPTPPAGLPPTLPPTLPVAGASTTVPEGPPPPHRAKQMLAQKKKPTASLPPRSPAMAAPFSVPEGPPPSSSGVAAPAAPAAPLSVPLPPGPPPPTAVANAVEPMVRPPPSVADADHY